MRRHTTRMGGALALTLAIVATGAETAQAQAAFVGTGSLNNGRYEHAAVLLADGRPLVVGGWGAIDFGFLALASAETYDATTESWSATGQMAQARIGPSVVRLQSGKVLVAGGYGPVPDRGYQAVSTAELFDPVTGSFSPTGTMAHPRYGAAIQLLTDGRVLVAGGTDEFFSPSSTAEIYDPATGVFSPTGDLPQGRTRDATALLPNGDVLLAGGCFCTPVLYNTATAVFTSASSMTVNRPSVTATVLDDGRVLVAGGYDASGDIYDPTTGSFSLAGLMVQFRIGHTATRIPSGQVLLTGGNGPLVSTEVYSGAGFAPTSNLRVPRTAHTATRLLDGRVLIAGGVGTFLPLQSAELFYESGYIDTVAPVITVPEDITVGAFDSGGIYVTYQTSATDNLDTSVTVICEPPSGTVFPVGTTTVNCSAADLAGNPASASFNVTVIPPFEVGLSFDPTSSVNPVTGLVTIRGAVSCNRDAGIWISGTLSQVISSRAVVSGSFGTSVECVAPGPTPWSATVSAEPSRFKSGKASVQANAGGCNVTCDAETNSAAITLRAR